MKKNVSVGAFSLGAAALLLAGVVSLRCVDNKLQEVREKREVKKTNVEEVINEMPRYEFHYYNDTVDVEESVNSLGITKNDSYIYESYRFIRFVDNDHREKYAICVPYVEYEVDEKGEVINTIYNYYDAFNGTFLLSTNDKKTIQSYNSDLILYLMESGKLLDLKKSVISKGLDEEYANSVMGNDIKNKSLNTYDVARMYVLLVNSSNRLENSYVLVIG